MLFLLLIFNNFISWAVVYLACYFFLTGGGVWAVYPIIFSISNFCGIFHCMVTAVLAVSTITSYCLASFKSAGAPAKVRWGSYPMVGKSDLENYTFCTYCNKPKPPRAHHCRSCKMCVVDMDHHCPFVSMITANSLIYLHSAALLFCWLLDLTCWLFFPSCSSADWQLCGSIKSSSFCNLSYFCGYKLFLCCWDDHICKLSDMALCWFPEPSIISALNEFLENIAGYHYYGCRLCVLLVSKGSSSGISSIR